MSQSNWEAWVDTMPSPSPTKLDLHVHGDIKVNEKAKYELRIAVPQGINPKVLILEVFPNPSAGEIDTHLEYHEAVSTSDQYSQVQIREIEDVTVEVKEVS